MKFKYLIILISVFLLSCSSSKKAREFKLDYKVVNASHKVEPDWLEDADDYKGEKEYTYFVSMSENTNRRLCVKSATARSTAVIASEISQEITNDYTEVASIDEDSQEAKSFKEELTQSIRTKFSGVRVKKQYWEKRQKYNEEVKEGKPYYACYSLVGIKEDNLKSAIKYAQDTAVKQAPADKREELKRELED